MRGMAAVNVLGTRNFRLF